MGIDQNIMKIISVSMVRCGPETEDIQCTVS